MGGDFYKVGSNNRLFWYPPYVDAYYTPTFWRDGHDSLSASGTVAWWRNQIKNLVDSHLSVASPVQMHMDIDFGAQGDTGTAYVQVVATDPITYTNLYLTMCVVEDGLFGGGQQRNQVVRRWLPNYSGTSFSIAEGDTFNHSRDFVIDPTWTPAPDANNCRIVAFVQDRTVYDVLQSIQGPVYAPAPAEVAGLTATLVESDLRLDWSPVAVDTNGAPITVDSYQVYRDTDPAFPSPANVGSSSDTFYVDDSGVVGDAGTQYYYAVTAVAGYKESDPSEPAGEYDRALITGK